MEPVELKEGSVHFPLVTPRGDRTARWVEQHNFSTSARVSYVADPPGNEFPWSLVSHDVEPQQQGINAPSGQRLFTSGRTDGLVSAVQDSGYPVRRGMQRTLNNVGHCDSVLVGENGPLTFGLTAPVKANRFVFGSSIVGSLMAVEERLPPQSQQPAPSPPKQSKRAKPTPKIKPPTKRKKA